MTPTAHQRSHQGSHEGSPQGSHQVTGHAPRPTAAARPAQWAADAVAALRDDARLHLDHSAQSLWRVDRHIEDLRREGTPYAAVEITLRGLGAYAGEVIVRQTGAQWWASGGDHWVRTPDGRLWEPLDEARRCFGGHGSLRLLCRDAMRGKRN
ncbi:hypothetical protein OG562_26975 [Streptomyces sp. NBC_01275]|uniref:hypothetical protein n=1 Tax=Streptomyces sp. NBC_01275 TaxID=2903807 RepID=UPI00225A2455|nr:hypothetical protein [Streptomyces sp. NBC_01275]MCX4764541.1 hypothetical protein [Streptomyces sp. NBC_01275]